MRWLNRKVFVTGAGGFIGSHLTELLLQKGARVRALVHYNSLNQWGHLEAYSKNTLAHLEVVAGDIRDASLMERLIDGQEYVFHLAALIPIPYSYVAPQSYVETNVLGTLHVLEASRKAKVRKFLHTSTSEVYGSALYVPIDEKHPLQAQSPYAATKIGADQLVKSYHDSFDFPALIVRPFNTFGPRQSARAVIPTILSNLLSGKKEIHLGSLKPVRDYNYVGDTAAAFIKAAESPVKGRVINAGSGKGWTVKQVVEECVKVAGVSKPRLILDHRRVRPQKSEVWRLICDNTDARRLLKWKPEVSFQTGLARAFDYIKRHQEKYKTHLYNI